MIYNPTNYTLRKVTHIARMKKRQFAEYINRKNGAKLCRETTSLQLELDFMRKRYDASYGLCYFAAGYSFPKRYSGFSSSSITGNLPVGS